MESTQSHATQRGLPPGERAMRLDAAPRRSLVVAAAGPRARLETLLGALLPAAIERNVELVVARACGADEYRDLAAAFPAVLFMPAADGSTSRQLRAIGLTAADGDVVAIIDDDRPAADALALLDPAAPRVAPRLSVIVPAHDALATVRRALEALAASDLPRDQFELLLIDDGSTDETSMAGAESCDCVVRLAGRPKGPAFARNRGVEVARGDILVFVDVDVVVHRDALRRLAERFERDASWTAVFGSYDEHPADPGFVSQYRNLLHTWMHQRNRGEAETFWAGLAAIRRDEFVKVGMFDEWHYGNPTIEDIELGQRLRRSGHRILSDPDVCGTHLKRWTFRHTLISDLQQRGVPEMWLQLADRSGQRRGLFNKRSGEQLLASLAAIAVVTPVIALLTASWTPLLFGAAVTAVVVMAHAGLYVFLVRLRGPVFAVAAVPMHMLYLAGNAVSVVYGWVSHHLFGEPIPAAEVTAHAQMGIETWPPPPRRSRSMWETSPPPAAGDKKPGS